jgi:hypothetical protein
VSADATTLTGSLTKLVQSGITAFAGGGIGSAVAITGDVALVSVCATNADSVKLPVAAVGKMVYVYNGGAASLAVFPVASSAIDGGSASASVTIPALQGRYFKAISSTAWVSNTSEGVDLNSAQTIAGAKTFSSAAVFSSTVSAGATTLTGALTRLVQSSITAFATGGQGSAVAITGDVALVSVCATAGDSVKLPVAAVGKEVFVYNGGVANLAVFPVTSSAIDGLSADASVTIPTLQGRWFRAVSATAWVSNTSGNVDLNSAQTIAGAKTFSAAATFSSTVTNLQKLVAGGVAYTVGSAPDGDCVIHTATDNAIITLPDAAAGNAGQRVTVQNTGANGAALISISPHSSDGIFGGVHGAAGGDLVSLSGTVDKDAQNTKATALKGDYLVLVSNGSTGWYVIGGKGVWASQA